MNKNYSYSTLQQLTASDRKQLDALGFHLVFQTPVLKIAAEKPVGHVALPKQDAPTVLAANLAERWLFI